MTQSNPESFTLEPVSIEQVLPLRARILRPHQPIENSQYPEDHFSKTLHLAVLNLEGEVLSCGTFISQAHPQFSESLNPYRLRGMATAREFQKLGLGRRLLASAESLLQQRGCDLIWFNARTSAEGFYTKLSYTAIDKIFDIPGVGDHKIMYKNF